MAYQGFQKMVQGGMSPALAAYIGRKKYSAAVFNKHAAEGKTLRGVPPAKKRRVRKRKPY